MSGYQSITIQGNVGQEPEYKTIPNGKGVCNFSVAVSEKKGDDQHTEWFRCVAWERTAEVVRDYVHKGDPILLVGRIQTRDWTDQQGQKRTSTEVVVDRLVLLGSRRDQPAAARAPSAGRTAAPASSSGRGGGWGAPPAPPGPAQPAPSGDGGWGGDVPF